MEESLKLTKLSKCAGCGAKVGAGTLQKLLSGLKVREDENLLVGFDRSDDAAVYRVTDDLCLVETVDFFPPIADDPYIFGQIAAANALSDIYAMGGEPKIALNIMCIPENMEKSAVQAILRGGYDKVYEAGASIVGGHSIYDDEPKYGLAVTGFVQKDRILKNCGAQPGDVLFYTKPLGLGVLSSAAKAGVLSGEETERMLGVMATLNRSARDIMVRYRVHACTDVTGFSLLGHGCEMAEGSQVSLVLDTGEMDFLGSSRELAAGGILPAGMYRNRQFAEALVDPGTVDLAVQDLLYDPQTSGGLLIAVDKEDAAALQQALRPMVPSLQRVGEARPYAGDKRIFLR